MYIENKNKLPVNKSCAMGSWKIDVILNFIQTKFAGTTVLHEYGRNWWKDPLCDLRKLLSDDIRSYGILRGDRRSYGILREDRSYGILRGDRRSIWHSK